jgi:hypothetical protein
MGGRRERSGAVQMEGVQMNHLGDTNKMVDDKTIIEWNADVGTRFLTIYPDGSFHINQNTPPLYALGELAKAFIKQQERIKRLEEFARTIENDFDHDEDAHRYGTTCRVCDAEDLLKETKAKEAKL